MPTPRLVQIQISSWSYSRYQTYEQCPAKAKYQIIDKLREPDSPAGEKGTRTHAIAAAIATGQMPKLDNNSLKFGPEIKDILKGKKFPVELETFQKEFKALRKVKVFVEQDWAFNREWQPTGWFAQDCWLRIKVDLHFLSVKKVKTINHTTVHIIDHKTGKEYEDHKYQRSLYALGAFLVYPDAEAVEAAHWYLDPGVERKERWEANQLEALKKEWLKKTTAMLNDTTYAPRPNDKCKWCHFRKGNDGPCKF